MQHSFEKRNASDSNFFGSSNHHNYSSMIPEPTKEEVVQSNRSSLRELLRIEDEKRKLQEEL